MAAGILAASSLAFAASALAQPGRAVPVRSDSAPAQLAVHDFDVEQVAALRVGTPLVFSVFGTAGASVVLAIDGVPQALELREVAPGVYEGTHTVGAGDRIAADGRVVATLRRAGETTRVVLQEPLVIGTAPSPQPREVAVADEPQVAMPVPPAPVQSAPAPVLSVPAPVLIARPVPARAVETACHDCAVVESIVPVAEERFADRMGQRAGGVAGTIFGERIGEAHGRNVRRVFGAIGHVFGGGRANAEDARRPVRHDVVLRLSDGSTRQRRYDDVPSFRVGETIRLGAGVEVPAPPN